MHSKFTNIIINSSFPTTRQKREKAARSINSTSEVSSCIPAVMGVLTDDAWLGLSGGTFLGYTCDRQVGEEAWQ